MVIIFTTIFDISKTKNMKLYKAIVTEKNSPCLGQVIANTKIGQYKGMGKDAFYAEVYKTTCWAFEIVEI